MDCLKCGHKLWGSSDSSECVNDKCGNDEIESIPVTYVWGLINSEANWVKRPVTIKPLYPSWHWKRKRYPGAMQEVPIEQESSSNN